jgi:hypothetical protein
MRANHVGNDVSEALVELMGFEYRPHTMVTSTALKKDETGSNHPACICDYLPNYRE